MIDPSLLKHEQPDLSTLDPWDWFDNSILDAYLKCPRLAWYQKRFNLDIGTPNMAAGTVLHKGMEVLAETGDGTASGRALARIYAENEHILKGQEARFEFPRLYQVMNLYANKYKDDPIKYAINEWPFAIQLEDANGEKFWLVGKTDGVGQYLGDDWNVERKTGKTLRKDTKLGYELSRQASTYTFGARTIIERNGGDPTRIKGVVYDLIAFSDSKTDFDRFTVFRSNNQLEEWLAETRILVARFRADGREAEKNRPPVKNRTHCSVYGECPFIPLCGAWEQQVDKTKIPGILKNFRTRTWNPIQEEKENG